MHSSIGQNIKSVGVSSLRRLSPRLWRDLWTDLHQIWNIASTYDAQKRFFDTDPFCHGNEKLGVLTQNYLQLDRLMWHIWPKILHQTGSFKVAQIKVFTGILKGLTPVAMITKIWQFQHTISHNFVHIGSMAKNPKSSRGFQGRAI